MMKKLYKWDLIHYIGQLKWIYLATLFLTVLSVIFKTFSTENIIFGMFYQTTYIVSIVGVFGCLLYTFFSIFQRYYQTILKDEAYFTHTLPISKGRILLSKILSGFSLFVFSLLLSVGLLHWLEVININEFLEIRNLDQNIFNMMIVTIVSMVIMFLVFIIVIYAALSFGFSYNKREWLYVFVYFVLYYIANQVLSFINFGINFLINPNLLNVETNEPGEVFSALSGILIVQLVMAVGLGVANFYIARYLMTRKINLKNG